MEKFKSLNYWIFNIVLSFGVSFIMSIFGPLLQGAPVLFRDVLKFTLYTGIISMIVTTVLPLDLVCGVIAHIFTKKENKFLKDIIYTIILSLIMSISTLIILDHLKLEYWISLGRVFMPLVIIAYFASMFFKWLARIITDWVDKFRSKA